MTRNKFRLHHHTKEVNSAPASLERNLHVLGLERPKEFDDKRAFHTDENISLGFDVLDL
jgi:hypothetical protein